MDTYKRTKKPEKEMWFKKKKIETGGSVGGYGTGNGAGGTGTDDGAEGIGTDDAGGMVMAALLTEVGPDQATMVMRC